MKTLYIDCSMGCAGDMLTAALLELHPNPNDFISCMNSILSGKAMISAQPDTKCGISGTHVSVSINGDEEGKPEHHHHHHTDVAEIMEFIGNVSLPERVKADAKAVFTLIAEAESQVHGIPMENVHFHEVGSFDALADVLNVCQLIYELAPEKICASQVNVGSGQVHCAHGILPVPAPATEQILHGVPIYSGMIQSELCTPTGAALLKHFVSSFGPMPALKVEKAGYGTGEKDFEAANVVRVLLGDAETEHEQIFELSCNLDDMTPEELAFAMEELFSHGALDVYFTAIGMKKSRPGVMLTCLCSLSQRDAILKCIFKHTATLGIRENVCNRYTLQRSERTVQTPYGKVRVKQSQGYGITREKAEYEDLTMLAKRSGKTLREIRATVKAADFKNK